MTELSGFPSGLSAPAVNEVPHGNPFSWRFTTPLFIGSALNPINGSLIATALVPIAHGARKGGRERGNSALLLDRLVAVQVSPESAQERVGAAVFILDVF